MDLRNEVAAKDHGSAEVGADHAQVGVHTEKM